jgi:hypothetical protein
MMYMVERGSLMGTGHLKFFVTTRNRATKAARPVADAEIEIISDGNIVYKLCTDISGQAGPVSFEMPLPGSPYSFCDVSLTANNFAGIRVNRVKIFPNETALLPIILVPKHGRKIFIDEPPHRLEKNEQRKREFPKEFTGVSREIIIPDRIIIHKGKPDENARNVAVVFRDYLKNVCAHETFPTWPQSALEAIIYTQASFVLNRIYSGWYGQAGFDITCDGYYDQEFIHGGQTYEKIDTLVDRIFNRYVRREGFREPFFDDRGGWYLQAVKLAEQGRNALEILRAFFPRDLQIVETLNIAGAEEQYPGHILREGMKGEYVKDLQRLLNGIAEIYPGIPAIHDDGYFGPETTAAVKAFLQNETGVVDKAGWYKICFAYPRKRNAPESTGAGVNMRDVLALSLISKMGRNRNFL